MTPPPPGRLPRRLDDISPAALAMLLMLGSGMMFSAMHATIRHVTLDLPPIETAFIRNLFGLLVLMPWLLRAGPRVFHTRRLGRHALRGMLQGVAMMIFFVGVSMTPLAEVAALSFTAPLWATVGAFAILGESVGRRRVSALLVGFAGALVVVRPGFAEVQLGSLLLLASSATWAMTMLVIKSLSRTESAMTMTAYMAVSMTVISFLPALYVWQWPRPDQLVWLLVMGTLGTIGHLALAAAFKRAETSLLMPLDFVRLIWSSALGYMIFAEVPPPWTWAGGAMILASASYIAWRESRLKIAKGGVPMVD